VNDRELMLVNLDLLDAVRKDEFPPRKLNFILYNPMPTLRSANIKIPVANGRTVRWSALGKSVDSSLQVLSHSFVQLTAEF
jgi:hypothetical protein